MYLKNIGIFGVGLVSLLFMAGCQKTNDRSLNLMLNNQAKENYYVWIGENRLPEGRAALLPGGFRPEITGITTHNEDREGAKEFMDDQLKVHASKDGKNIISKTIELHSEFDPSKSMYVRWNGSDFTVD